MTSCCVSLLTPLPPLALDVARARAGELTALNDTRHSRPAPDPAPAVRRLARFCDAP